jgi:Zn-dependent peptidase ImmA (M78 family)
MVFRNDDGTAVVGVNSADSLNRQRFTIAHELGHLILHGESDLHVDEHFPIGLRSGMSAMGVDDKEIEANQFAAELLMPSGMITGDVELLLGTDVDKAICKLAKKYGVSTEAMSIRLSTLGFVK